jgi:putative solute:sodium symporter small subunit
VGAAPLALAFIFMELVFEAVVATGFWPWAVAWLVVTFLSFWLSHRRLTAKFERAPYFYVFQNGSPVGFVLFIAIYTIVGAAYHLFEGYLPHFAPGLAFACWLLATWWKIGRIARYHLFAAVVSTLLAVPLSLIFSGSSPDHHDGLLAHPALIVILAIFALVAILDYRLLLDLRDIANSEPAEPAS